MKCLVQTSGGLDSAAALLWAINNGSEVYPLFYHYGQPYAEAEETAAIRLCKDLGLLLHSFALPLNVRSSCGVAEYIPYRNLILTTHSVSIAAALRLDSVVVGCKSRTLRSGDPYSFRDSTQEFFIELSRLVNSITEPAAAAPIILMPLSGWSKAAVVKYIREQKIDPDSLWTCYRPGPKPCGVCYHCKEYEKALVEANA